MNYKQLNSITLIYFISLLGHSNVNAQISDTIHSRIIFKKTITPLSLIGFGILINTSQFEKNLQTDLRNIVSKDYELHMDDYSQYAPLAEMYIANIIGVKARIIGSIKPNIYLSQISLQQV